MPTTFTTYPFLEFFINHLHQCINIIHFKNYIQGNTTIKVTLSWNFIFFLMKFISVLEGIYLIQEVFSWGRKSSTSCEQYNYFKWETKLTDFWNMNFMHRCKTISGYIYMLIEKYWQVFSKQEDQHNVIAKCLKI